MHDCSFSVYVVFLFGVDFGQIFVVLLGLGIRSRDHYSEVESRSGFQTQNRHQWTFNKKLSKVNF